MTNKPQTMLSAMLQSGLEPRIKTLCQEFGAQLHLQKGTVIHVQIIINSDLVEAFKQSVLVSACGNIAWQEMPIENEL